MELKQQRKSRNVRPPLLRFPTIIQSGTLSSSSAVVVVPNAISTKLDEHQTGLVESSPYSAEDRHNHHQQVIRGAAAGASGGANTTHATTAAAHLVNKHMVLPFIPPKFVGHDSDTLLKPSEYLRSICNANGGVNGVSCGSLSKARSVDNLDIQGRGEEEEEEETESDHQEDGGGAKVEVDNDRINGASGPPPPPLPPPAPSSAGLNGLVNNSGSSCPEADSSIAKQSQQQQQQLQPLATISIHDLTSVQLRRTNVKMHATKTFSAPPNRSVSMTNVSEAFFVQKTDLIAELKKTKDIPGIKKMKVQQAQVEKSQEQTLISEISKAFSISNFVEQIPEKDSSGNIIPIWKRQMLARKAAERAKKELEEQIARENEEKRQKAIPPWKRQLLAKKDSHNDNVKNTGSSVAQPAVPAVTPVLSKIEAPVNSCKKEPQADVSVASIAPTTTTTATTTLVPTSPSQPTVEEIKPAVVQVNEKRSNEIEDDTESVHIIPWRAQLRKTNSKLNILD
ncbi:hypothetical protein QAD02_016401 [Eretmocerus hayati]|uniref:Uncharacterized protein n=1 Tax=Eretmocerus hayati TaxID=131215 RepID=A0ACC2PDE7_9HYME|nr:hypothetical protein QAD02_016401 [Eretmocerus hayati]